MPNPQKSRVGPLPLLAGVLVTAAGVAIVGARSNAAGAPCDPALPGCPSAESTASSSAEAPGARPALQSEAACRNVGYLCAELATRDRIHLRRWKDFSGTIVVHVPRPDFEESGDAARLQEAAARGLRAWNGQPFQILTDLRGSRAPHFSVRWTPGLPGNRIGVAQTEWSSQDGLSVVAIQLATRHPYARDRVNDARQVQLTAAHEMGHALGLQHSDSEADVMFPSNTATSLSARDYRTMEVLYGLPDGTEIVR